MAVRLPNLPPVVPWVLGFAGVGLVWASLKGESPIGALRAVITGNPLPGGSAGAGSPGAGTVAEPGGLITVNNPAGYSPATFKLTAPAAAAYRAWTIGFGAGIPVTTGYRSPAEQQASKDRATAEGDPDRFADPSKSWHVRGTAVDVDNDWLGRLSASNQTRLRRAAKLTGWGQARYKRGEAGCGTPDGKNDNDEPWHFSFGGCG